MKHREGIPHPVTKEWLPPEKLHEVSAEIMQRFDSLPRHLRDFVNENGYLTTQQARAAGLE